MLSLIYARSLNHCIGAGGRIPWRLPNDFAHFKNTTMGKPIIMGRKTYEDHQSALPGRLNIVVSRQQSFAVAEKVELVHSLDDAIELAKSHSEEIFVIGGVVFFVEAMPLADIVYETVVQAEVDGDSILPAFDFSGWQSELLADHPVDERHDIPFSIYKRTRK